jgi:HPt (histidine-containing phosphotransfer) domain-containing protein
LVNLSLNSFAMSKKYSLEYLKSISGGDEDFIKDMIQTFVNSVPDELVKIKDMIDQSNWYKAGEIAHKFCSNLLYLELEYIKEIASKIETLGLSMEHTEQIPVLFDKLNQACSEIIQELKKDFEYLNY